MFFALILQLGGCFQIFGSWFDEYYDLCIAFDTFMCFLFFFVWIEELVGWIDVDYCLFDCFCIGDVEVLVWVILYVGFIYGFRIICGGVVVVYLFDY